MSELWIVVQREFRERVRSRAFILTTLLLPLLAVGIFLVPYLTERAGGGVEHHVAVVDEVGGEVPDRLMAMLRAAPESDREDTFRVEHLPRPLGEVEDSLTAAVRDGELDGYLWLPPGFVEGEAALYRARNVTNMGALQRLRGAASAAAQAERLDRAGLDGGEVAALLRPAPVATSRVTRTGEEGGDAVSAMVFAYVVALVLYMFIILYGTQVMQSVHEEKTNRIAEVLMSSIRAPYLLAGKVFGVGGAALVQILFWGALVAIAATRRERIAETLDMPAGMLSVLQVDPGVAVLLVLFALLGFFLYAAVFAMVGAATENMQDGQQFVWIILLPLIIPLLLQFQIVSAPHGALATAVGWIPFTAPLAMPIRMGAADISAFEIAGSLVVLMLALGAVSWVAGKIYRVGMLSTGKRASLKDLWQWVRTA